MKHARVGGAVLICALLAASLTNTPARAADTIEVSPNCAGGPILTMEILHLGFDRLEYAWAPLPNASYYSYTSWWGDSGSHIITDAGGSGLTTGTQISTPLSPPPVNATALEIYLSPKGSQGEDLRCNAEVALIYTPSFALTPVITEVAAEFIGPTQALVTWGAQGGLSSNAQNAEFIATASPGGQQCTSKGGGGCTIDGLLSTQSYTFSVVASSRFGGAPASPPSTLVTYKPPPGDPTRLKIKTTNTSAMLTWKAATSGPKAVNYEIETIPQASSCSTSKTTCTITGLKPGKTYWFALASTSADGAGSVIYTKSVKTPVRNPVVKKFVAVATTKVKPEAVLS